MNKAIRRVLEDDEFILSLADRLMLDEILCGECSPSDFLRECIRDVMKDKLVTHHEVRLKYLKRVYK